MNEDQQQPNQLPDFFENWHASFVPEDGWMTLAECITLYESLGFSTPLVDAMRRNGVSIVGRHVHASGGPLPLEALNGASSGWTVDIDRNRAWKNTAASAMYHVQMVVERDAFETMCNAMRSGNAIPGDQEDADEDACRLCDAPIDDSPGALFIGITKGVEVYICGTCRRFISNQDRRTQ